MRVVIDTNLWISYLLRPDNPLSDRLDRITAEHKLLYSYDTLKELAEVLTRPKFARYIDRDDVHAFIKELEITGESVTVDIEVDICRDPKDNHVLALAVCGRADCILTGDKDLLTLIDYQAIPIIRISAFDAFVDQELS